MAGGPLYIYINGTLILSNEPGTTSNLFDITSTGFRRSNASSNLWTYSGGLAFIGFSLTQGATTARDDLKVGQTIDANSLYYLTKDYTGTLYLYSVEAIPDRAISLENLYEFKQKIDETVKYKALYHLGAYDSVDTTNADYDLVTRGTGYVTLKDDEWIIGQASSNYRLICEAYKNSILKPSGNGEIAHIVCNKYNAVAADTTWVTGVGISVDTGGSIIIYDTNYNQSTSLPSWLENNSDLSIQYELADSYKYTEKVLKNQPLSTLDQNGENWLRGMYEKTLNLINGIFTNGQAYAGTGNTYSDSNAKCILSKLEPNTQYALNNGNYSWVNEYDSAGTFLRQKPALGTFTTSSDCVFVGLTYPISENAMLNYGSTVSPYQPYNGPVLHAIDVEGIKLWENGNPTSAFGTQTITTADMSHFKYLVVEYSRDKNGNYANTYSKNKYTVSSTISLFYITTYQVNTYIVARDVAIVNNTTINFGNGTINGETNNDQIIPVAIYGIK